MAISRTTLRTLAYLSRTSLKISTSCSGGHKVLLDLPATKTVTSFIARPLVRLVPGLPVAGVVRFGRCRVKSVCRDRHAATSALAPPRVTDF
jgi:hypothetical protein